MEINVPDPRIWWRTSANRLSRFVPEDPDEKDNYQRWEDRDSVNWELVAREVVRAGNSLAQMKWPLFENTADPETTRVSVDVAKNTVEARIVERWFILPPSFDPWNRTVTDGRHRIWNTLPYFNKTELVPIRSADLPHACAFTQQEHPGMRHNFSNSIAALRAISWFDPHDPLNAEYEAALDAASRGLAAVSRRPSTYGHIPPRKARYH